MFYYTVAVTYVFSATFRYISYFGVNFQESSYNPYYSLVGQQLSRTAHAHKITLQFTLWDFLRDLGESNVGGAAVIKNTKEDVEFDVKSISKTRIQHVAKAYAWWIAKDCASLMILKVSSIDSS